MSKQQEIIQLVLKNTGFKELNQLQEEALKETQKNNDLVVLSQTGSGKTVAFLLPLLLQLNSEKNGIQALVLAPSRELAIQIETVFKSFKTNFKVLACYGGHSMQVERNSLSEAPAVLIGTPGRVCDHIHRENFELSGTKQLVIDEYDKCLEFGFEEQMRFIREHFNKLEKTTLVSATEMEQFPDYLQLKQPKIINFLSSEETPDIRFYTFPVRTTNKFERLFNLLCSFQGQPTIVFCNYREATESITTFLKDSGYESIAYHGGMEQEDRERALIKFRNGSHHTLVCTDLGARGLDIPEIQHVVHFQYPHSKEAFIHRNGRTARMKANGSAYLMLNSDEDTPEYLDIPNSEFKIQNNPNPPVESPWITIYFSGGKKDKINKIDLVGFLGQKGGLKKEDIGLITVLDFSSFVALKRKNIHALIKQISHEKVKGKKLKIAIAR
ncbi:MAG: DEAD/DEAH box helicase [Cryomorphaceae bacterium]|jgi:ATP-independent RNA helicase DbpA|nr:DEAD/DEAH box helicase [Cryomorphaceae bacterium]